MNGFILREHKRFDKIPRYFAIASACLAMGMSICGLHAAEIDLTGNPSMPNSPTNPLTATVNDAIFQVFVSQDSAGSGVLDPFVRLQNNGVEEGYNADARPVMPNVNTSPTFTHDFTLASLNNQVVDINGTLYYQFLLDYNENNSTNGALLSLDDIKIYTGPQITTGADEISTLLSPQYTLQYNLQGLGGNNWIKFDTQYDSGSGRANVLFFVPISNFADANPDDYVYFYSQFGVHYSADATFEEWGVVDGGVPIPEPSTIYFGALLLGTLVWKERGRIRSLAMR